MCPLLAEELYIDKFMGAISFLPGGAKMGQGLGGKKRAEARRSEAAEGQSPLSLGKKIVEFQTSLDASYDHFLNHFSHKNILAF